MIKKIQDHFKKPEGIIGKIVGKTMAVENRTLNAWTIKLLKIRRRNKVLEVGYGPGYAIDMILRRYSNVHIDGIDISETMKEEASHRLVSKMDSGEVVLFTGDIAESALQPSKYDVVFTVNNYTLWENKYDGLHNIYDALMSNGKIAITMQPRQEDAKENQAEVFAEEIRYDLKNVGFRLLKTRYKRMKPEMAVCVMAIK